ncbi:ankyrin repeat domain-containing protein [Variovorax sp. J22P168]|uniref:ankyrin repeat domain-containing protein n=1 Tax=Variovorax jilinensis TaxID=3053513 RepID=UPI002575F833|nr:ankyrin repeat domain-containing protein [Variovorax sp. J22P168]MDM0013292.1 ankyrin repeat domain-containing protein [Variovorax sp. J22P168]
MTNYFKYFLYLVVLSVSFTVHANDYDDFFRAARADNPSGMKSLLAKGFDPNTRDEKGQTGLMIAMREPSPKVVDVLIAFPKTDVNARNASDESPLMLAALKGQQDLVNRLIERDADINKPGWTPLHYAATSGQVAIMKQLLDKYAYINAQSPNGTTPLMMAAMYGSAAAVQLLLDEGADVGTKNQQGMTAADFAERGKRPDAVQLLGAAAGAKPKKPADGKW